MSLQAQESKVPVSSNYTGIAGVHACEYKEQTPMVPGAIVAYTILVKELNAASNAVMDMTLPKGFIHLSITRDGQVAFAQPVYNPSSISVFSNGDLCVDLHRIQDASEIPDWLWSSIQVKAFDFQNYIEQVTETWIKACEWAKKNGIEIKDIISQYPNAIFPNDYKERDKLCDLMPSCMHGARRDPEITTSFPNVVNLSWQIIQGRWMQDHPDFKVHPTDQEIKNAEQLFKDMGYPIFCH